MSENPDAAADQDSSSAERRVWVSAVRVGASVALALREVPRKFPLVEKPWEAEREKEMVITATKETRSRYSEKGGLVGSGVGVGGLWGVPWRGWAQEGQGVDIFLARF